jgi:hypothetical protein
MLNVSKICFHIVFKRGPEWRSRFSDSLRPGRSEDRVRELSLGVAKLCDMGPRKSGKAKENCVLVLSKKNF